MNDRQSEDAERAMAHDAFTPQQKVRLRAAIHMLVEYLIENGYLTHADYLLGKMSKADQIIPDASLTPPENST